MTKREVVGYIKDPHTGDRCEVRKDKNGKLYYVTAWGPVNHRAKSFQDWITARLLPAEGEGAPPPPPPAEKSEPAPLRQDMTRPARESDQDKDLVDRFADFLLGD